MSRDNKREQSNCVDRVGRILELVISVVATGNLESQMWKDACDVGTATSRGATLTFCQSSKASMDRRTIYCRCRNEHASARDGLANSISSQLVYDYVRRLNLNTSQSSIKI